MDDDDDPILLGDASLFRRAGHSLVSLCRELPAIQLVAPPVITALLLLDQSSKSSFIALAMFLVLKSAWVLDTVRSAVHPARLLLHAPTTNNRIQVATSRTIDERIEQSFRAIFTVMVCVVAATFTLTLLVVASHNHTLISPHLPLLMTSTFGLLASYPSADTWILLSVTMLPLLLAAADPWVGHLWTIPSNQRTPTTLADAIRRIDFGQLVGRVRLHVACDRDHASEDVDTPATAAKESQQVALIPVQVREMVPMVWSPLAACPNQLGYAGSQKSGTGSPFFHDHGPNVHISGSEASCAICLTPYVHGDPVWRFNCGHHFHSHCVVKWISMVCSCPMCRSSIEDMGVEAK